MPFNYQTPQNPFVGSIGEMIARRGDITANAALREAAITGAADVGEAAAYGGAIADIGRTAAGVITQVTDPRRKLEQEQLTAAQRENRSRNVFELELQNPKNYKPDGTVDDARVTEALKKQDVGAWQQWAAISAANQKNGLDLRTKMQEIAKNDIEIADKQRLGKEAQGKYLGELAFNTEQVLKAKPGDPLHARDTFMASVARGITDGVIVPSEGKALLAHTAAATPDQLLALVSSAVPPQVRGELEKRAAETARSVAEASKATAEANAIRTNGLGTPPAAQAKAYRVKGVGDVPLEFVPGRTPTQPGAYFLNKPDGTRQQMYPGQDFVEIPAASLQTAAAAGAAASNLPGWALDASRPSGAEGNVLDKTLHMTPNGLFQDAQTYIATGQYPQSSRSGDPVATAKRTAIDSKVGAIAAAAGMDVPTLRAFYKANAGSLQALQKSLDSVQSFMATADKNVDLLEKILPKVPDVGSPIFNQPLRSFEKNVLGNEDLAEVATFLKSAQNEYARIVSQPNLAGQLTDSARHEAEQLLEPAATVGQMVKSIRALKAEGTNRVTSLGEQIQKIGARMQAPPPGGGGPPPAAAGPVEGTVQPIAGHPGAEQTFRGGKWVRTK